MKQLNHPQRTSTIICAVLTGLVISQLSLAEQDPTPKLIVSGQAVVADGGIESAIARATLDALRSAATQRQGQMTSQSIVSSDGQLTENIRLKTSLNISRMDLLEQIEVQGVVTVKLALELDEGTKDCPLPQLTQVVTTDLATPPNDSSYHQVDINQLLLDTEAQFSSLAKGGNFVTHRINPALNTYQTAWLASEAYNQADYHLAIGAQWLSTPTIEPEPSGLGSLMSSLNGLQDQSPNLMLTATFSSPYGADIDLRHQQQFTLPANRSISQSGAPIPQELSKQVAKWVEKSWRSIHQTVKCEGSYIKLSKIIDQPLWRINKGQKLGLEQGQKLLLLPQNYEDGILNPDARSAPLVFKVTQLQPHAALLEHVAGPDNITNAIAQVIVF
ncbi:hypothetical protein [Candidatus Njordibacter sp. Uisw_058]|uniref:hypothetical protein n=1 Tax=Candidatus Njordibacter sp. Uisw_058 TaxID=3230974 RepID=UPI003D3891C8